MPRPKSRCSIDGCDDFAHGGGLCELHYSRKRRYGDPLHIPPRGFKGNQHTGRTVPLQPHGTNARYQSGCFCHLCVGAHATEMRSYKSTPAYQNYLQRLKERRRQDQEILQILRNRVADNWQTDLSPRQVAIGKSFEITEATHPTNSQ